MRQASKEMGAERRTTPVRPCTHIREFGGAMHEYDVVSQPEAEPDQCETFERRRLRVYVAGPISSDPMVGIHRAFAASREMFLDGLAPFIPHSDAYWFLGEGNWNAYLEYDLEYVAICDAVYRLSGESKGATLECKVAMQLGIPVFFEGDDLIGYDALIEYAAVRNLTGVRR